MDRVDGLQKGHLGRHHAAGEGYLAQVLVGVVEGVKEVLGALLPKASSGTTGAVAQATAATEPSAEESPTRGRSPSSRRTHEPSE